MSVSLRFPVRFEADGDHVVITARDFFGASQASGDTATATAQDYLATCIEMLIESGKPVPRPSRSRKGETLVAVPIDAALVAMLDITMRDQRVAKSELARRMGKDEKEIRRLLSPKHGSKASSFRRAFEALGTTPTLAIG